jgi:hypothetical protein
MSTSRTEQKEQIYWLSLSGSKWGFLSDNKFNLSKLGLSCTHIQHISNYNQKEINVHNKAFLSYTA